MLGNRKPKPALSSSERRQLSRSHAILREIDKYVDFTFFVKLVEPFFSPIGRKSIDPVVILKMMFLGYMCGLRSDREIVDECIDRNSFREFLGYNDGESIPVHTNFTNWRQRLRPEVFEEALGNILDQCEAAGLRLGNCRLFDSTRSQANASTTSSSAKVELLLSENPDEYLAAFSWQTEHEDPKDDPRFGEKLVINTNDPEARLLRYGSEPSKFVHKVHMESDSKTGLIVNTTVSHKTEAQVMLECLRHEDRYVRSVGADSAYGTLETYHELERMGIKAYIPIRDHANDKGNRYHLCDFTYCPNGDTYICPNGKILHRYCRRPAKKQTGYRAEKGECAKCPVRDKCIAEKTNRRTLTVNDDRPLIEKIKFLNQLPAHKRIMRRRKAVAEGNNAHAKTWCGMARARGIGIAAMRIQAALTAVVINVKKLIAHIRQVRQKAQNAALQADLGALVPILTAYCRLTKALRAILWASKALRAV